MGRLLENMVNAQLKFDSKLINTVKYHHHLFDKTHKLFEDLITRSETWETIGKQLDRPGDYCEKRWIYIINRLYDEIIWMIKYDTLSPWLLFPQLNFLADFIDWSDLITFSNDLMDVEAQTQAETVV